MRHAVAGIPGHDKHVVMVHRIAADESQRVHRLHNLAGPFETHIARHREALVECQAALGRALLAPEVALAAEDLRLAVRAIGRITGTVRIDELLDVIFRDFCIGK